MLLQFLVDRGVKVIVFGFEKSALSKRGLRDPFATYLDELIKLVLEEESVYLYTEKSIDESGAEGLQGYKQLIVQVLRRKEFDGTEISVTNPS